MNKLPDKMKRKSFPEKTHPVPWESLFSLFSYLIPVLLLLIFRYFFPANICDDAFISFKTALNLSNGNGMVFNLGQKIYVCTTPLWVFLLAITRLLTSDVIIAAKCLGILFEILFLLSIVHLGFITLNDRSVGMLAAVLICTNPIYLQTSFSGMELSLYLFLIVFSLILLVNKKYMAGLTFASLAIWARIDGLIIFAVVLSWTFFVHRNEIFDNIKSMFFKLLPSSAIIGSYILFGLFYFGSVIPSSVQSKSRMTPRFFSPGWIAGTKEVLFQFIYVFIGKSGGHENFNTPSLALVIPLIIGLFIIITKKKKNAFPLLAFTLLYACAFIGTGNSYAIWFPWYFVPVLPGLYLIAALGYSEVFSMVIRWLASPGLIEQSLIKQAIVLMLVAVLWTFIMLGPLKQSINKVSYYHTYKRERLYASTSVWLGRYLEKGATIAANEIGAVGFFSRSDIHILDMFGLLRKKEEIAKPYLELMQKRPPEAVLTLQQFSYTEGIITTMKDIYIWLKFNDLEIGLRKDIFPVLYPHLSEVNKIYTTINIDGRELFW